MKEVRRSYDKEFKLMAIELCQSGKSTKQVADDIGVRRELVARWKRETQLARVCNACNKYKRAISYRNGFQILKYWVILIGCLRNTK